MTAHEVNADVERSLIERAFIAVRYALGQRQPKLLERLFDPCPAALRLAHALGHNDRHQRARALAADLKPVVKALDKMRVA